MALLLPNSVFFHAGRTGGHWVKHVVLKAGLMAEEVGDLHSAPADVEHHAKALETRFSFTFVRHPITWLRSVWCHQNQFGWSSSSLSKAASDNFGDFVERACALWPSGPVGYHLSRYFDHVSFVGRFEELSKDLQHALLSAGENFSPTALRSPRINETPASFVVRAARAPRALLAKAMHADSEYARRFGYEVIPESVVDDTATRASAWPVFQLKTGDIPLPDGMPLKTRRHFVLSDGTSIDGVSDSRTKQIGITEALANITDRREKSFLDVGCSDGYYCFLASDFGFRSVVGIDSVITESSRILQMMISTRATFRYGNIFALPLDGTYDVILVGGLFALTREPSYLLSVLRKYARDGTELIFAAYILRTTLPIAFVQDPGNPVVVSSSAGGRPGPAAGQILSESALRRILYGSGFIGLERQHQSLFKVAATMRLHIRDILQSLDADEDSAFERVVYKCTYSAEAFSRAVLCEVESNNELWTPDQLDAFWRFGKPSWLSDPVHLPATEELRSQLASLDEIRRLLEKQLETAGLRARELEKCRDRLLSRLGDINSARYGTLTARQRFSLADEEALCGWHAVEVHPLHGSYRWTGPELVAAFVVPAVVDRPLHGRICVIGAVTEEILQDMKVVIAGRPVACLRRVREDGITLIEFQVPWDGRDGRWLAPVLAIEVPFVRRPCDIHTSSDSRAIGVAISAIEMWPVGAGPRPADP